MTKLKKLFNGAWLTDVDDTLIGSGVHPDDNWIKQVTEFVRALKAANVAWVPVSGVSIIKMGPRLLYRLPDDVLSHVYYYGGEGSSRSYYEEDSGQWENDISFQQDFSDAQALVVIGKDRFLRYLHEAAEVNKLDINSFKKRVQQAERQLLEHGNAEPAIIDQMQKKMQELGFDPEQSETYFRGGAVSWMMFGDKSADYYQGPEETAARNEIAAYARQLLTAATYYRDLGDSEADNTGVGMPYPHAARGIKIVLEGNNKGRAVKDMIAHHGVDPQNILFTGNELYEGGNDNTVRDVIGLNIVSVGKKVDPGVINAGDDIIANQNIMQLIQSRLEHGVKWVDIMPRLQMWADRYRLSQFLSSNDRVCSSNAADKLEVPEKVLSSLLSKYKDNFKATRNALSKLTKIEYDLVVRMAVLEDYHYDQARKLVHDLLTSDNASDNQSHLSFQLRKILLPELKAMVKKLLVDQFDMKSSTIKPYIRNAANTEELEQQVKAVMQSVASEEIGADDEYKWIRSIIKEWSERVNTLTSEYFSCFEQWQESQLEEVRLISEDNDIVELGETASPQQMHYYLRCLLPRIDDVPHLKDLDKPTIILIAGTSGVGKSMVTRSVSKALGIPTSFSTDVASRSVVRNSIRFLLGKDVAREIYPELYGSSFSGKSLNWFYTHARLTMVGVIGHIDRLIKENISGVIEGVALIPGTLPEHYFEKANIVWVVVCVKDKKIHFERLGTRDETGVERGGSEKYRQQFDVIRQNHDRLVEMAKRTNSLVVDNSGSAERVIRLVQDRVADPFADRGLPVKDKYRKKAKKKLKERRS